MDLIVELNYPWYSNEFPMGILLFGGLDAIWFNGMGNGRNKRFKQIVCFSDFHAVHDR